jgi:putative ABC transport system permease protein
MILQQALFLAMAGYGIAYLAGQKVFPKFPRRVILLESDLFTLALIVLGISIASSILGIYKAVKVNPNEALAG